MAIGLIVENDPQQAALTQRYLSGRGVEHDLAGTPQEAIAMLRLKAYDFMFLDLDLGAGIVDGEGVLAWMGRSGVTVPTVIISESASLPAVIKLENAHSDFVRFRMSHGDLLQLGDLVEQLLKAKKRAKGDLPAKPELATPTTLWQALSPLLAALIAILFALAVLARWLERGAFLLVLSSTLLLFATIAIIVLRREGKLSDRGFRHLLAVILRRSQ